MRQKRIFGILTAAAVAAGLWGCKEPRSPGVRLNQAAKYLSAGKYAEALSEADSAVQNAPGRFDAFLLRAIAQERTGRSDLALASAMAAEKLAPGSFAVQYMLGRLYMADRKNPDAVMALNKALALRPGDRNTLILLVNLYMGLRPAEALKLMTHLERDSSLVSSAAYRNELGVAQILCGNAVSGGNNLSLAVSNAPKNAVFRLNYARYLDYYANQPMSAVTQYRTYLELAGHLPGHENYRKQVTARCNELKRRR